MNKKRIGIIRVSQIYYITLIAYMIAAILIRTSGLTLRMSYLSSIVGILCLAFSGISMNTVQRNITITNIVLCIFFILSAVLSSVSLSSVTTKGRLISSICIAVHMILFSALLNDQESKEWDKLFYILCAVAIIGTIRTYSWADLMKGFRGEVRLGAKLLGINIYGMTMAILSLFSLYKTISQKRFKVVHGVMFVILIFFSVTSGSRKAFLCALVGVPLFLLLNSQKNKVATVVKIAILAVVALYLLSTLKITNGIWDRLSTLWDESNTSVTESDRTRDLMIEHALKGWLESPIWGHGFNTFTEKNMFGTYSHCNYAELLFNTGIIGLLLVYVPRIFLVVRYFRKIKLWNDPFAVLMLTVMLLLLAFEYACISYYETVLNFYWWIALAYLMKKERDEKQTEISAA